MIKRGVRVKIKPAWFATKGGMGTVIQYDLRRQFPVAIELDEVEFGEFKIVNVRADEVEVMEEN